MQPYVPYSLLAVAAYALVAPLMRIATSGANAIPSDVAAAISNIILVAAAIAVVLVSGQDFTGHVGNPKVVYVLGAGCFLAIGILSYYRALALGPVSVVTPIFATFLVFSSVIGVLALGESVTLRKVVGIVCAIGGVYLVSTA
ncbi:EamA family transporter [Halopenitus persicus]|uniref:Transporter family protein n=1 Tax=Halopenitus persicus TaxID=1048396 RepID=A0A1H3H6E2_9EURY|nr:EamA family transporter [Halopenitus persicus]QHS16093.1 EamA family transporter [haloarchaeon 3A1-DGR]SDY10997.1 transporter family protein [Halopenitus persicus]